MKAVSGNGALSSGELADLAGVSRDTLRHYERKGVLLRPLRGRNGYRQYPPDALQRVELVRRALSFGFTLDELAKVLKVRDAGGAPCEEVRRIAAQKLVDVQDQLRELTALRDDLQKTLRDWDARLARRASGNRANLLESLSTDTPAKRSHRSIKRKKEK
ncbi:MAG TPA: heavy metal-responsive transcriptional regulator [Pyrinomonadaceae bacterium]|jgi:MerR family transcriptional regulator, Zn(II)-responsive regulator of zntA|nr:heavy metal-responsive transcriptional regulator [Pyrinomonadaceae bacterium]